MYEISDGKDGISRGVGRFLDLTNKNVCSFVRHIYWDPSVYGFLSKSTYHDAALNCRTVSNRFSLCLRSTRSVFNDVTHTSAPSSGSKPRCHIPDLCTPGARLAGMRCAQLLQPTTGDSSGPSTDRATLAEVRTTKAAFPMVICSIGLHDF